MRNKTSTYSFSYKHPKRRKLRFVSVEAESMRDALKLAPHTIRGGYVQYGCH